MRSLSAASRFALCLLLAGPVPAPAGVAHAATEAGVRIALRATADLPGTRYALADIADVDAADAALEQRLRALAIGAVPRRGYTDTVAREQVEGLVRQVVPPAQVEWAGAPQVRIRGQGQHLAPDALADAAAVALRGALDGQFTAIELRPVGTNGVNVPAGAVKLAARVPAPQLARRMSALVEVRVDGEVYTSVPVWFAVRATRPALLARVPLQPGTPLRAEDFQLQNVDVTDLGTQALAGTAPIAGLRLRRALEPGMALAATNVETRPSVTRAAQVAVRVVQGAVTIETVGTALADARIGEITQVRNTNGGATFPARVVGDGVVLVSARQ